jgi:hypothetical protein
MYCSGCSDPVLCWTCRAALLCCWSSLSLLFPSLESLHRVHSHSHCTHCSLFRRRGPRNDAAHGLEGRDGGGPQAKGSELEAKEEES